MTLGGAETTRQNDGDDDEKGSNDSDVLKFPSGHWASYIVSGCPL